MEKGVLLTVLVLMTGMAFVGGVWGQKISPPGTFNGTITKVDLPNKEIVVQNNNAEAIFQWNDETAVKGLGERSLIFENLQEGMMVTISYREENQNRVASLIEVKEINPKTLKGFESPFECGRTVC